MERMDKERKEDPRKSASRVGIGIRTSTASRHSWGPTRQKEDEMDKREA